MSAPEVPAYDGTARPVTPSSTYDEYAAGMDGLSFGWLYARFVEYMKATNMSPESTPVHSLAKRVDVDNSTDYVYADNRNYTAIFPENWFFNNATPPLFELDAALLEALIGGVAIANAALAHGAPGNASALVDGPESATSPVPELLYCGVKWKREDVALGNPQAVALAWMKDVRGMLITLVVLTSIILVTSCVGLCLSGFRRR
jgi:hypothetical protein